MSINSEILRLETAKADIKEAIEAKGVAVDSAATLDAYAEYVDEISGGGTLQEKSIAVIANGTQTVLPDSGYDGFSKVVVNAAITGDSSALDFSIIGYDSGYSAQINAEFNADIAYSKSLMNGFNVNFGTFNGKSDMLYAPMFDFSRRTDYAYLFLNCASLKYVPPYNTSSATNMRNTFSGCKSLTSIPQLNTSNVTSMFYMFAGCSSLKTIPMLDTSHVTDMRYMFQDCSSLTSVPQLDMSSVRDANNMFISCSSLTSVSQSDMSNVINAERMFQTCKSLTSANIDLRSASAVTYAFSGCTSLTSVTLDISSAKSTKELFHGCSALTSCQITTSSALTDVSQMFDNCKALTTIPLFDTSNVTVFDHFLDQVAATTIPQFDVSKGTSFQYMFSSSKIQVVPSLNTSSATNVSYMFNSCTGLTSIGTLDFSNVSSISNFFGFSTVNNLTDLGGFIGLKCNWNDGNGLAKCNNLTVQSLNNVIAGLYDFTGHGQTPTSTQGKLKLGSANYNKLTAAEIAVGTAKGWTITA